jgi:hypothetical protein
MGIPEISAALAGTNQAMKAIAGILSSVRDVEGKEAVSKLQDQILDLQSKLFSIQSQYEQLAEEKREAVEKIKQMEYAADVSTQLVREQNYYFRTLPSGKKDGPYCLACWDGERKLINVQMFAYGRYQCGRCEPDKFKRG